MDGGLRKIRQAYGEMGSDCRSLSEYRSFYGKNPICLCTYPYRIDNPSELMDKNLKIRKLGCVYEGVSVDFTFNNPNNITELIRENERECEYLSEGLIRSFDREHFIKAYQQYCKSNVDSRLFELTETELGIGENNRGKRICEICIVNDNNTALITVLLPIYDDEYADKRIKHAVDSMFVTGWNISSIEEAEFFLQPFEDADIRIIRLTFEQKYHSFRQNLDKDMYHVTPARYIDKILKNGLVPTAKSGKFKYPPRVYLFMPTDSYRYTNYALQKMALTDKIGNQSVDDDFYIIGISAEKLKELEEYRNKEIVFYSDPLYARAFGGLDKTKAIYTHDNIPPSAIKDKAAKFTVKNGVIVKAAVVELRKHAQL